MKKCALFCVTILLVLSLVGCGVTAEKVKESISQEVIEICESYGLQDITVDVGGGEKSYNTQIFTMFVTCSNFKSLSYNQMLELEKELDSISYPEVALIIGNYKSGEDYWDIFESGRNIRKNGKTIYEDYANSEIRKSVQKDKGVQKDKDYSNGTLVTDRDLKSDVWVCAKDIVEAKLKSPSTAEFCSVTDASVYSNGGHDYTIKGYVDAENEFGAVIRNNFIVTLTFTGNGYTNGSVTFS